MKRLRDDDDADEEDDYEEFDVEDDAEGAGLKTGDVDLSRYGRGLYLIKLPTRLIKQLEDGAEARLRVPTSSDADTGRAIGELQVEGKDANKPSKYELQIKPESADIVVFSSDNNDDEGKIRVEGTVSHQCIARPQMDARFRSRLRKEVRSARQPRRKTVVLNDDEARKAEHRKIKVQTSQQLREIKYQKEQRRRYVDMPEEQWKEKTTDRLFELFGKQSHWSLTAISNALDEPQQRLKALLGDVCIYNKSGPHRNMYELKDEYKTVEQREQKAEELQARREARKAENERQQRAREEREAAERS